MSGAQGQGGAAPQASGDLAPMQMLQSYKSAPDRAAWMQQNQSPAQQAQPWQPPQRMYAHQPMQLVSAAQKTMTPMRNAMTGQSQQGAK